MTERLSWREKHQAYRFQVWLHARKDCEMCGLSLLVEAFEAWGYQPCWECAKQLKRSYVAEGRASERRLAERKRQAIPQYLST